MKTLHPRFAIVPATLLLLASCAVGPDYQRPSAPMSTNYKEYGDWKPATPSDAELRGSWWAIYHDAQLDAMMKSIVIDNQTIIQYMARYRESKALSDAASSAFLPTFAATASETRERGGSTSGKPSSGVVTQHLAEVTMSWEIDLWGKLRRELEEARSNTQASAADLENARLSVQTTLASDYFQVRALDTEKQLLDETVAAYQRSLNITQNQYKAGVAAQADVVTAETQLRSTQAQAIDVGVGRAQLEHAMAVLLGKAPADFALAMLPLSVDGSVKPPVVPTGLPSQLLERRPDIAAAERRMSAANAAIGVQVAAFYPDLTLSGALGYSSSTLAHWFTAPNKFWSVGPALALTLFDNGERSALVANARATYDENVALYRQTVLGGLQQVEDNLVALRVLEQEQAVQDDTVRLAQRAVVLALNQYKAGTVSYINVVTAQATELANRKTQVQVLQRRLDASVMLIKAVGGGWDASSLPLASNAKG